MNVKLCVICWSKCRNWPFLMRMLLRAAFMHLNIVFSLRLSVTHLQLTTQPKITRQYSRAYSSLCQLWSLRPPVRPYRPWNQNCLAAKTATLCRATVEWQQQRQVWLIPIADERLRENCELWNSLRTRAIPERFIYSLCIHITTMGDQLDELWSFSGSLPYLYIYFAIVSRFVLGQIKCDWLILRWWSTTKRHYIKCMHLYPSSSVLT